MRKHIILYCLLVITFLSNFLLINAQPVSKPIKEKKYEMKQYWFVMLVKGKKRDEIKDTTFLNKIQQGHLANIGRLAELGKIIIAGPFGDNTDWRGIFIFNAASKEEVKELLQTDPAIKAGRLDYEIHPWWTAKGTITFQ